MTQFAALQTSRSVRTRRLAAAEENIEVARAARLAQIFKEICDGIVCYKGDPLISISKGHTTRTFLTCHLLSSFRKNSRQTHFYFKNACNTDVLPFQIP